jgi:hypothetical protein
MQCSSAMQYTIAAILICIFIWCPNGIHGATYGKPISKPCSPGCERYGNCNIEEGR